MAYPSPSRVVRSYSLGLTIQVQVLYTGTMNGMEEPLSATAQSTSRLVDVSPITDILASSSKVPLEQLVKASSQAYLSDLTDYGLQELLAEPAILQTQSHHLTSSLTSLTHTSYPTFLSLHQTTNALTESLTSLSSSLDVLLNSSLPALEASAAGWKDGTDGLLKERSRARLVLEQHDKVRDLLEIPILIDTCVRNGYFAEALSLVSHANSLASTAPQKAPPILSSVLSEIHHSIIQMLLLLLGTLHEPNRKLPALYKAVNFLRKMDVFGPSSPLASGPSYVKSTTLSSEVEKILNPIGENISSEEQIALAFLTGRETFLKTMLEPCSKDVLRMTKHGNLDEREQEDLARYLKTYIDRWREGVYDIITQYTTIFLEKNSPAAQALLASTKETAKSSNPASTSQRGGQEWIHLHTLITTYASRALTTHLLPILTPSLPFLSLSQLPSLLTQVTYCSTAFARVGLEYRGILSTLFSHAVEEMVKRNMQTATDKFVANFQTPPKDTSGRPNGSFRTKKWEEPSKWLLAAVAGPTSPPIPMTPATPLSAAPFLSQGPPHIPPQILASYPPVAEYTNALLSIFNGLRLLAPTSILFSLAQSLDDNILFKSGEAVLAYIKAYCNEHLAAPNGTGITNVGASEENEKEYQKRVIIAFGQVFFQVFIPFMRRALVEGVYSSKLDATFQGGNLLPGIVMDWEDFVLETADDEESGEESDDDDDDEEA